MNLLEFQDWSFPVPVVYGPGRLSEIAKLCEASGMSKPLLVTDRCSQELPFIGRIMQTLDRAGILCGIYAGISPNPRDDEIAAGRNPYRKGGHDGIIAVGGGSGISPDVRRHCA